MTIVLTGEQEAIVNADLRPLCVVACAGSGKTTTAVRRLLEIRRRLGQSRGYVALLSYSNVAVETFRSEYRALLRTAPGLSPRVLIETVDSFVTTHILHPHAARVMGSDRQPFLVQGSEPFLANYKVYNGKFPSPIENLRVSYEGQSGLRFTVSGPGVASLPIENNTAKSTVDKLGRTGAYTHELGRYWALATLSREEHLLELLARRYPQIIVDEAQDVGTMHGALLGMLSGVGSQITLIGDPHQAIYEFAYADGSFIEDFADYSGALRLTLSENRRSVASIVESANKLTSTASRALREPPERKHGAFYIAYEEDQPSLLLSTVIPVLEANGYRRSEVVVLCRANSVVQQLTGVEGSLGQGATEQFARAALLRDVKGDVCRAFEHVVRGIARLLDTPSVTFHKDLLSAKRDVVSGQLRTLLWRFLRDSATGLPDAHLSAQAEWQPELKRRVSGLLTDIESHTDLKRSFTWVHSLTTRGLDNAPLVRSGVGGQYTQGIRVDTVHKAKGESIGAVLYLARNSDVSKLLEGPVTEDGRIGYVAVTRAKDLLIVSVPRSGLSRFKPKLEAKGFVEWGWTIPKSLDPPR